MRIAVISDVHANLSALEAVIADLRTTTPDLVIQGGDLVSGGARPAEVIDRIREMNWPGVYGNTDEMLWAPHRVSDVLRGDRLQTIRDVLLTSTIPSILTAIGDERLSWLRGLPLRWSGHGVVVVHATPDDVWPMVPANAADEEMERTFGVLGSPHVAYGHIHLPFVRPLTSFTLVNIGAVSQSFDGDPRASYALLDDDCVEIRRVEYDVEEEIRLLLRSDDPFAKSTADALRTGRYVPA